MQHMASFISAATVLTSLGSSAGENSADVAGCSAASTAGQALLQVGRSMEKADQEVACMALPNNQGINSGTCAPCAEGQAWWPCNTPYCDCSGAPAPPTIAPPVSSTTASQVSLTTTSASTADSTSVSPPGSCAFSSSTMASWFSEADFAQFFPNVNNNACTGKNFFNWCSLLEAAEAFPGFCDSGVVEQDRLELAAFLAQTSHETTGGWATAPGGPQAWGYCFKEEVGCDSGTCTQYCAAGNPCADKGFDCTCAPGQTYHGRGPMQLSWNYNYGYFSEALLGDASVLLNHPSQLTSDPVLAYKAAIWFWMTAQAPKPSCHAVLTGQWSPTTADQQLGRTAGFGMCTNIINGGIECNKPTGAKVTDRVEFFKRYLSILKVSVPDDSTLYCDNMASYR